jgi:hypothetical protein
VIDSRSVSVFPERGRTARTTRAPMRNRRMKGPS